MKSHAMNPRRIGLAAFVLCSSLGSRANAQDARADLARRDLLGRAERARAGGDHAEALRLGLQAAQIRTTPSLRLMLAEEYTALGQAVDALDQASACEREAGADAALRNRETILAACQGLVAANEPRVGRLAVDVNPRDAAGLRVFIGNTEVPRVLLGIPTPTAPGMIVVRVEAQGATPILQQVNLRAGQTETVRVDLSGRVAVAVAEPAARTDLRAVTAPGPSPSPPATVESPSGAHRALGWVALSAGAVGLGLGIGGIFYADDGARAYNDNRLSNGARCPGASFPFAQQPGECQDYLNQIAVGETMQWGGLIAGGVLAVTGIVLLATAPSSRPAQTASIRCGVNPLGLGMNCGGSF
jgi:hypothetical protein